MRLYSDITPSARGNPVLSSDPALILDMLLRFVQLRKAMCFGRKDAPADYRAPAQAISYPYIGTGTEQRVRLLAIDIDHSETGIHCWSDAGLPPPHFIVQNPAKPGSIHLIYALTYPVNRYGNTHVTSPVTQSVASLYQRVREAITRQAGGDPFYAGHRVKSPACEDWISYACLQAPAEGYTLSELAAELDMRPAATARSCAPAEGSRNIALLHHLIEHARTACRQAWSEANLAHQLQAEADALNATFPKPLSAKEVARVIRWVAHKAWAYHATTARPAFVAKQKARSKKGNAAKTAAAQAKAARIAALRAAGMTWAEVAAEMGLTPESCRGIHKRNGGIPTTWGVTGGEDAMCCNAEVDMWVDEVEDQSTNREESEVSEWRKLMEWDPQVGDVFEDNEGDELTVTCREPNDVLYDWTKISGVQCEPRFKNRLREGLAGELKFKLVRRGKENKDMNVNQMNLDSRIKKTVITELRLALTKEELLSHFGFEGGELTFWSEERIVFTKILKEES